MAAPRRTRPGRTLVLLLALIVVLFGSLAAGSRFGEGSMTPDLALDLEGGTQLILTPRATDGSEITDEDIEQAIAIMRQRVDASGVSEAEITSQGASNIVVALPGTPDEETIELVGRSAQLRFRPVLFVADPGPIDVASWRQQQEQEEALAELDAENMDPEELEEAMAELEAGAPEEGETEPPTPEEIEEAARQAADADGDGELSDQPAAEPADETDPAWMTEQVMYEFYALDCTDPANRVGGSEDASADPIVSCAEDGTMKYVLGPSPLDGGSITDASSGQQVNQQGMATGQWVVNLRLDGEGRAIFGDFSETLYNLQASPPRNQFAIVLDGLVVSAPTMNAIIHDGRAEISGNFTPDSAATLANQLNFGSLPIDFEIQSQEQISATLGTEQLQRGLLAGAIGALLVIGYLIWQYRGLGLVAVGSLVLAGVLTYGLITLMSWLLGYRLSLPGVVGLAISVGITADSFIVYFERIRDEVREGRTLAAAIQHGWPRARRTILASDAVNFIAAAVLYLLAVGGVQGFAFTLGLVTLVDLIVIFLFTHPVMLAIVKTKFFGQGHKLSGLHPESLGATSVTYRGRGRFGAPVPVTPASPDSSAADAGPAEVPSTEEAAEDEKARLPVTVGAAGAGSDRPAPDQVPLPPPIAEDGRKLTIAERRALQRKRQQEQDEREAAAETTEGGER